jgi:hypothetical protein
MHFWKKGHLSGKAKFHALINGQFPIHLRWDLYCPILKKLLISPIYCMKKQQTRQYVVSAVAVFDIKNILASINL